MRNQKSTDEEAIRRVVQQINEFWLSKKYDEIGELLAEDAVVAPPGTNERVRGREAHIQSYREYDQMATTHEFSPGDPQIDIVGDVAVAQCPFSVVYELEGKTYREKGRDVLVLSRSAVQWKVVWRTVQIDSD